MQFIKKMLTWWHGQTLNTQLYTWLYGQEVGQDAQGNLYYQSRHGDRRWVIFNGESEASRIGADWHGWLHHTFDAPPNKAPLPKPDWIKPHRANATGTPQAYAPAGSLRANGRIQSDYVPWKPE